MEYDSLGRSIRKFPGATKHLKRWSCFFRTEYSKLNSCSISSKPSLKPGSGLRGRFWKMELICTNGKRDSGTKFTRPEFCVHLWTVARKDKTLPRIQKHFPESKTRPRILGNLFGFWEVFSILRSVFVFWDVFWILGSVFGFWKVFCSVGSVLSL